MMQNAAIRKEPHGQEAVHVRVRRDGVVFQLVASGSWTVGDLPRIEAELEAAVNAPEANGAGGVLIDLSAIDELDTAGAWLLERTSRQLQALDLTPIFRGATEAYGVLLDEVRRHARAGRPEPERRSRLAQFAADAARALSGAAVDAVDLTAFLGEVTVAVLRAMLRPWRFRWTSFVHHLDHAGLRAAPIVCLISVMIGAVVLQQGVVQLRRYGSEPFAVDLLGILALREVGVILTAIMVAGRSSSAFTAEIGTMKMREEIDAMRTLGIDPIETLVAPRILALVVALPLLTFLGDVMCLVGGGVMSMIYLDFTASLYLQRLHDAITLRHFVVGMVKAPFAALIVGLVGCLEGLRVTGSAESVGVHVTAAVVKAIFLVFILDAAFAIFMAASGY